MGEARRKRQRETDPPPKVDGRPRRPCDCVADGIAPEPGPHHRPWCSSKFLGLAATMGATDGK